MALAAKSASRMVAHMAIAFVVGFVVTGSFAFGGLAALIEPLVNVLLLPLHEKSWQRLAGPAVARAGSLKLAEKASQTVLHFVVALVVLWLATGSLAIGGLVALVEPIANVILLPHHDRLWTRFCQRIAPHWLSQGSRGAA